MENFFGIMKPELLYVNGWNYRDQFRQISTEYLDYYNNVCIKLKLKGLSPVKYRTKSFKST